MADWKSFINQRIRWASKATSYDDKRIFWVLLLVYLLNAFILLLLPLSMIHITFLWWFIWLMILKGLIELPFMLNAARFFSQQKRLLWFIPMQPVHIAYTVISGWLGRFGKYEWKGRTVK
jgi:hypothetical protein